MLPSLHQPSIMVLCAVSCVLCPVSCVCFFLPLCHPAFSPFSLSAVLLSLRFPAFYLTLGSAGKPVSDVAE